MKKNIGLGLLMGLIMMTVSCGAADLNKVEAEMTPPLNKLTELLNGTIDKIGTITNADEIVTALNTASEGAAAIVSELKLIENKYNLNDAESAKLLKMMTKPADDLTKAGEKLGKTVDDILLKFDDEEVKNKIHQARMNLAYSLSM
ncbi:MAG: hypothetical protein A2014_01525 [Spirochaetes bacterium GWF1_49_6]|jgi:ABC-type transporter Mla subunit MlaD|nr:MAG: hypothetical protein A2014_01525 [Spirochaetes bacterium GWF1_49_6]